MRGIRFYLHQSGAALVVEGLHQFRIALESFGRGDILDTVTFPEAVRSAERRNSAFRRDAGAGKDDNRTNVWHRAVKARAPEGFKQMTRIGILGAAGRMGKGIVSLAPEMEATVSGGIDRDGAVYGDHADAEALARNSDVLIDFSTPTALAQHLTAAVAAGCPILIGTTGLDKECHDAIDEAARKIAVLQSANTSLGVNLLRHLVRETAARLGPDWDIEVLEMHHRDKVDAPSGTALLLGESAAQGRGATPDELDRLDRFERKEKREPGTIGYASLRGGSVPGDHSVIFASDQERIELSHHAQSRGIFARGAVRAALWLADKPPGRYDMNAVLGLG